MRLVAFEPSHLPRLRPEMAGVVPRAGVAFSLLDGDRVLGCAGLVPMDDHAEAWVFISDTLRARPMVLHRLVVNALRLQDRHWPKRLLAIAQSDSSAAQKWLERLGFVQVRREANWICYGRPKPQTGGPIMAGGTEQC